MGARGRNGTAYTWLRPAANLELGLGTMDDCAVLGGRISGGKMESTRVTHPREINARAMHVCGSVRALISLVC